MTTSTKVSSFTILKTKNRFILLCWKKQLWRMCTNFWINPHNGKLPSRLAPAQCQNLLVPQLLSNIYWSKTKTSISLNRVYWYDTMCHIFSCLLYYWHKVKLILNFWYIFSHILNRANIFYFLSIMTLASYALIHKVRKLYICLKHTDML